MRDSGRCLLECDVMDLGEKQQHTTHFVERHVLERLGAETARKRKAESENETREHRNGAMREKVR